MKKLLLRTTNRLLQPLGAEVVPLGSRPDSTALQMFRLLERLAHRRTPIRSVVDIGASDGTWSIRTMAYFPDAFFLAIEPLEERRQALETAKSRHKNFDYALCVAGQIDGEEVTLNVTADLNGTTVNGQNPGSARPGRVRTIDSLLAELNLPGPYLLKFDTHGYELPILAGSEHTLRHTAAIVMETYNFQLTPSSLRFHEMCGHLEALGFRPADIADPMLRDYDNAFWQMDILFLQASSPVFDYPHFR